MKSVKLIIIFMILLSGYALSYQYLQTERERLLETEFVEYTLPSTFIGPISLEFKGLASDFLLFKFMAYLGGRIIKVQTESEKYWYYIYSALDTITDLDPYYFDAYLFAEMFLTLQGGQYEYANRILFKGREYIVNDYRIPYYIGFNYYYYMEDNENGAKYLMEASRLPGGSYYHASLAARLSVYSSRYKVAILFLKDMLKNTNQKRAIEEYQLRIDTLEIMVDLEALVDKYKEIHGKSPENLAALVKKGLVDRIPDDPYGGVFFLKKESGQVYTTSNMLLDYDN